MSLSISWVGALWGKHFKKKLKEYSIKQTIVYCSFDIYMYMYIESLAPSLTNQNFQTASTKGYIHPDILTKILWRLICIRMGLWVQN